MDSIILEDLAMVPLEELLQYMADRGGGDVTITVHPRPARTEYPREDTAPAEAYSQDDDAYVNSVQMIFDHVKSPVSAQAPVTNAVQIVPALPTPAPEPMPPPPAPMQAPEDFSKEPPPAQPAPALLPDALTIIREGASLVQHCDEGTLMRIAQSGGYDPDPLVLKSQQYSFKGIQLGNTEKSRLSYLQCAAATAVQEQPQLLTEYGLAQG